MIEDSKVFGNIWRDLPTRLANYKFNSSLSLDWRFSETCSECKPL